MEYLLFIMNLFNNDSEEVQVRLKNKCLKANEVEQDLEKMYSILQNTAQSFRAYIFLHWCKNSFTRYFFPCNKVLKTTHAFFFLTKDNKAKENKTKCYPIAYYCGI